MNTKQWLKSEKRKAKYLKTILKKELVHYKKNELVVFQVLQKEMEKIEFRLDGIKSILSKQIKIATKIKKKPSIGVFNNSSNDQKVEKGFFGLKKQNDDNSNKSEKAIELIQALEKNSITIMQNQKLITESKKSLVDLFKKKNYRLIFIPEQVADWKTIVNGLKGERSELDAIINSFNMLLGEAIFKSASSSYAKNVMTASEKIEKYINHMDRFEAFVTNLEKIAGKECKGLVYLIEENQKKKYEIRYHKDKEIYEFMLKDIEKIINSI